MVAPYWSGQMKISLVSFGIQLYPAINSRAELKNLRIPTKSVFEVQQFVDFTELPPESRLSVEDPHIQAYAIPVEETLEIAHECCRALET